jgi:hypothetical protein
MPDSPTSETESDFVCDCEEWMRSACAGEPFYAQQDDKRYCVLHFPNKEKSVDFKAALQRKLDNKDFNFRGVWFPNEVSFLNFDFSAPADFRRASFNASTHFTNSTFKSTVSFSKAIFSARVEFRRTTFFAKADLSFATFNGPDDFGSAIFNEGAFFSFAVFNALTEFRWVTFSAEPDFRNATFNAPAYFNRTVFRMKADFSRVTFRAKAYFKRAIFSGVVYFAKATFSARVSFRIATFDDKADFANALFSATAQFTSATFNALASFARAVFGGNAHFTNATFNATADFSVATFASDLSFRDAMFRDYIKFAGDENKSMLSGISSLDLQFTKIERPDHVSFHHLIVRPNWFVFVNTREFEFVNVRCRFAFAGEIERLKERKILFPYVRLSRTFRDLAINCEERHRYREASRYRYWAMDTYRRERWRGLAFWRLSWWYWLASGYGEQMLQAFAILLGILLLSALLYNHVGFARWEPKLASEADIVTAKRDDIGAPLKFSRAMTYSAGVMTLQKPEPRPATTAAQSVVLLETVLGPVQAALLALAIRRRFMR